MATRQTTIDFLLDQLQRVPGVRTRKMFGEYALYVDDKVVALVCDDQLFVKITAAGKGLVAEHTVEAEAYPGAKPSFLVSAEDLEDDDRLCELIRVTADALPRPQPKPSSSKGSRKSGAGAKRAPKTSGIEASGPPKTSPRGKPTPRRPRAGKR